MSIYEVSNDGEEIPASGSAPGPASTEDVPLQAAGPCSLCQTPCVHTTSMLMTIHEVSNDGQEIPVSGSAPGPAVAEDVFMHAEHIQPRPACVPQPSQPAKTFFGLAQDAGRQGFSRPAFNDDYVARFPEDPYGQETAPNARAWRVYVEEAAIFDENMVGQSRDGLDVMLVFVSQNLQADFSEMSALLLHDLLVVQLAMVDGATVNVTTPSINPAEKFEPDVIDIWINGLWVVSLTTSLVVALAAVLVKQWLHRYMTFPSGTPRLRSHIRQFRFMGLEKWRVLIIIGMLPIIMHISLMLFFAGLTLFFIPLRVSLAWAVGSITVLVCVLYLVSNVIPIIFPQCPYQTPLTDFIHHLCQLVRFGIQSIRQPWRKAIHHCFVACRGIRKLAIPSEHQSSTAPDILSEHQSRTTSPEVLPSKSKSFTQLESDPVQDAHDTLSVDALDWLYHMSSNPTVHTLVLQGISGLPAASHSYAATKWGGARNMENQRYQLIEELSFDIDPPWAVLERLARSYVFLRLDNDESRVPEYFYKIAQSEHYDPCTRAVTAASWVASRRLPVTVHEALPFFASHSLGLLLHPLIWEEIVRVVLNHQLSSVIDESSLVQFVYLVFKNHLGATSPDASLMTGGEVVWTRLQPEIWDALIKWPLLARHDNVPVESISSYYRTLLATGKMSLSHVLHHRDNTMDHFTIGDCQHLELLVCVARLSTFNDPDVMLNVDLWTVVFDFLCTVITVIQDISVTSLQSQKYNHRLHLTGSIQSFYWHRSSLMPEFHFPRLEFLLQTWAGFYDCIEYDSDLKDDRHKLSNLSLPMDIMGYALSRGHEEAYRIFKDGGWMGIIFTDWAIWGYLNVIRGCIEGLYTLTSDLNRRKFCEYLHRPQQLILGFMLIIAGNPPCRPLHSLRDLVIQLAKICPTHTSWRDCDAELKAILAWAQTLNPEISLFPWPPSLQNLSATAAFRKYTLVDRIARRFSDQVMQECLEIGLETLHTILENAQSVEGVLIPDLETQTSIDTAIPA
ncbi:hypothetical protein BDZ89DRAFT_1160808 [Hymenopellis radicata]|nr:hypothetical protein BDZ89DRAFT_1160808 [Hymenopellis radicata]